MHNRVTKQNPKNIRIIAITTNICNHSDETK